MGTEKRFAENEKGEFKPETKEGLFGYVKGKRSFMLDSATGKMVLGVKSGEIQRNGYDFNEGQIVLVPGGESTIGNWRIGDKSLFSVHDPFLDKLSAKAPVKWSEDSKKVEAGRYREVKNEYNAKNTPYQIAINPMMEGIVISSNPSYVSVKGRPLDASDIRIDSKDSSVEEGDSLEVEINPRERSIFSIYRHHYYTDKDINDSKNLDVNGRKIVQEKGWYR